MLFLFKTIARRRALRLDRSHVPTSVIPLSEIDSAVVLVDSSFYDFKKVEDKVKDYFANRNIKTSVLSFTKDDLNWYGKPKPAVMSKLKKSGTGLYISLMKDNSFASTYCAVASTAAFKIGMEQIHGQVFDILITGENKNYDSQAGAFDFLTRILEQVI